MNTRIRLLWCFLIICLSMLFVPEIEVLATTEQFSNTHTLKEGASEPNTEAIEEQIFQDLMSDGYELASRTDIEDVKLYNVLLREVKNYIAITYNYNYTGTTIYTSMFKYIEEMTVVNDMAITSLKGIEKIKFNELKSLTIVGNSITDIPKSTFENMPKLETLNLACNKLETVDLTYATNLKNINLSSNNLSKVDVSNSLSPIINLNVANNNISSITDVAWSPRVEQITLNIISNNITDITEDYFELDSLNLIAGVQGLKYDQVPNLSKANVIKVYKTNIPNLSINIFKEEKLTNPLIRKITDSDITGDYIELFADLAVGNYYVEYQLDNVQAYSKGNPDKDYYKTYRFNLVPSQPVIKYEHKGKIYDTFDKKVTGAVIVHLTCEEGGKIYYCTNDKDWTEGNKVVCDQGGDYVISTKVVIDGIESETKSILIKTSLNTIIPDFVMLVLLVLLAILLFGVVVPLVSKKWFK